MGRSVVFSRRGARRWLTCVGALSLFAAGCAHEQGPDAQAGDVDGEAFFEDELVGPHVPDPIESINRPVFAANMTVDTFFVDPVSRAYGAVAPDPVKQAVRGVFANLNAPVVFVNEVLQLNGKRAAQTLGRFALNSTLGFGGIFNPAGELGWTEHHADFGQTLGKYGVGAAVDLTLRIDTWLLPLQSQLFLGGGFGISERENRREELRALRESSIDFYAAVRSAYLQTRAAAIRDARKGED